jgi:hypothetical protein
MFRINISSFNKGYILAKVIVFFKKYSSTTPPATINKNREKNGKK